MRTFLFLTAVALAALAAQAQTLPVTTSSEEAREHFERGRDYAFHFQRAQAIEHLDAAIAADPDLVLAYIYRAGNTPQAEREPFFARAEARRDKASEGEQRLLDAFRSFLLDSDSERAVEIYNALALDFPDDPYIQAHLGIRYAGPLDDDEKAVAHFERALELDPNFGAPHNVLGYIALDHGDHAAAEAHFREYVRLAPDVANSYDSLGEFYLRAGRYDEAAAQFERALAVTPDFAISLDNLVRTRIEQGNARFEDAFARQDAEALATLYTDDAVLFPPAAGSVTGREAVAEFWAGAFASGLDGAELTTLDVRRAGDVAYERGIVAIQAGGTVAQVAEYIVLWKETPQGWKLHHDLWTPTGGRAELAHAADAEWAEIIPGVAFASVYGDWQAEAHSKLVRIDAGTALPMHTHTHAYRGVMLQGQLTNPYVGESDPPVMGTGDAWYVPGGVAHSNACVSAEPCLFYTYGGALWDVQIVEN